MVSEAYYPSSLNAIIRFSSLLVPALCMLATYLTLDLIMADTSVSLAYNLLTFFNKSSHLYLHLYFSILNTDFSVSLDLFYCTHVLRRLSALNFCYVYNAWFRHSVLFCVVFFSVFGFIFFLVLIELVHETLLE